MKRPVTTASTAFLTAALTLPSLANAVDMDMQISDSGMTYYTTVTLGETTPVKRKVLIDSGSGFSLIGPDTLQLLQTTGNARYLRETEGRIADGSTLKLSVYEIDRYVIGDKCLLENVEVAILGNGTPEVLGMSALKKAGGFSMMNLSGAPGSQLTLGPGCKPVPANPQP